MSYEEDLRKRNRIELLIHLPFLVAGTVGGGLWGFRIGGVGGAIVFGFVGLLVGFILPRVIVVSVAALLFIGLIALMIGVVVFVVWGLYKLWGVGKP